MNEDSPVQGDQADAGANGQAPLLQAEHVQLYFPIKYGVLVDRTVGVVARERLLVCPAVADVDQLPDECAVGVAERDVVELAEKSDGRRSVGLRARCVREIK